MSAELLRTRTCRYTYTRVRAHKHAHTHTSWSETIHLIMTATQFVFHTKLKTNKAASVGREVLSDS